MSAFLGWTMAAAVGLTMVYIPYDNLGQILTKGAQWGAADTATYESLSRVLWAVCVSLGRLRLHHWIRRYVRGRYHGGR